MDTLWRLEVGITPDFAPRSAMCYALSRDGGHFATGSLYLFCAKCSGFVQVWSLLHRKSRRRLTDPLLADGCVRIEFLGETTVILVTNVR